jgi:hypothetical protein
MKWTVLAALLGFAASTPVYAIRIPPGGSCCPSCLCEVSPQLIAVPAFFALDTQTDPTQPSDWTRIKNAGGWVGLIVADANFESATSFQFDLHNAPTTQKTYGYVFTGSGSVAETTAMNHVKNWNLAYGPGYVKGIFFDVGPSFDPGVVRNVTAAYENAAPAGVYASNPDFQGFQQYYSSLYSKTHSSYSWEVMVNAPQWPNEWIVQPTSLTQGADKVLLWEESLSKYYNNWGSEPCGTPTGTCLGNIQNPPPAWWSASAYTSHYAIGHTVFAATQFDVGAAISRSWTPSENRTASLVYLHDRPQATYNGVACYFEQEINALGGSLSGPSSTWCGTCTGNNCIGACSDLSSDPSHCGGCDNHACPSGWSCQNAQCVAPPSNCPSGTQDCNGDGSRCVAPPRSCF